MQFHLKYYNWRKLCQQCNKYVRLCPKCQQVILKESQYTNLHLSILQFPMYFISMDILGSYWKTENGNQCTLTVISMLPNYVFIIAIKSKTTEEIIKTYLKDMCSKFECSEYILSDKGGEFTRKQFTWLAQELQFIKVYTCPYTSNR